MKYTIELTDKQRKRFKHMNKALIKMGMGFDILSLLEPIKTTNVEDTNEYQIGYKVGFEDGKTVAIHNASLIDELKQVEYNKALKDVNRAMDVLGIMTETEREEWFEDYASVEEVVREFTIQRIVESTKAYEEKKKAEKESIKVGDVVKFNEKCHNYDHVKSREFLVLHIFDYGLATILYDNGDTGAAEISLLDKTGRHFEEVEQLLDKLGSEEK